MKTIRLILTAIFAFCALMLLIVILDEQWSILSAWMWMTIWSGCFCAGSNTAVRRNTRTNPIQSRTEQIRHDYGRTVRADGTAVDHNVVKPSDLWPAWHECAACGVFLMDHGTADHGWLEMSPIVRRLRDELRQQELQAIVQNLAGIVRVLNPDEIYDGTLGDYSTIIAENGRMISRMNLEEWREIRTGDGTVIRREGARESDDDDPGDFVGYINNLQELGRDDDYYGDEW